MTSVDTRNIFSFSWVLNLQFFRKIKGIEQQDFTMTRKTKWIALYVLKLLFSHKNTQFKKEKYHYTI